MMESFSFITNEKHKKLVQTILNEYVFRDKVNGLMLIGSVARGDAYPESDLDFYILLEDGQKKKFHSETREGILVEYKGADFNQIQVNFKNNPMELYSFLEGKILFDKSGELKKLKEIATYEFENYRVSSDKVKGISHWLHSSLIKIQSALKANDELKASYIVHTSTWTLVEGIWAINNKPVPPAGSVLKYIQTLPNKPIHLDALLNKLFLDDTKDRIKAAIELIEWVLHK
ncbi:MULTISPECIES: nucleotidyltransferase domain-containing protein [Bacillus cereus group]|uniref:nucleotidyltransferase domain-containing protein n=1 Tax=Bacillus cereus group TaxID=86661 RepID=UPI0008FE1CB2|nr:MULTISPECIES: nucleotidyltransferase domain-containing protein [Bacillus cereus group]MCR6792976.1 nucleotidyltransferase domain-containing protein [Bacillus paranthracis]MCU5212728.1 nucleotidyltransferase domain-containing protein [Bacillus paranthracis]MDA2141892.1 nucleotidyltransferase domain-containing protein [Bacillus cereus group sp. Bc248]MDA2170779.1 nucleotidyltransferase domain-containing protein [Bacillus cereus group sp. Bc247]MDA2237798.1 nucleotidyltransferase domain-contai